MNWKISPGTMGAVSAAAALLGHEHVESGSWPHSLYLIDVSPQDAQALYLIDVSAEDAQALVDLFNEIAPGHTLSSCSWFG